MANENTPNIPKAPSKSASKAQSAENAAKAGNPNTSGSTNGNSSTLADIEATNAKQNLSAESAKEAELQKMAEGAASAAPNKQKNVKKLVFLLILIFVIAAISVAAILIIPNLLNNETTPELQLTNPGAQGDVQQLDFTTPVTEYIWGTSIDRGIAISNTGASDILVCFKLEIYETINGTVPEPITASPNIRQSLWTTQTITEKLDDGTIINSVYYYYNAVLASGTTNTLLLFGDYSLTAEDDIANNYAEKTVYSRVTVQYTNATNNSLSGATADCWQQCPSAWKSSLDLD